MADDLKPIGFWSYARSDDAASSGRLSQLRLALAHHVQLRVGREPRVEIFQDQPAIAPGAAWQRRINQVLNTSSFFVAILTPAFLQSEMCCREVMRFRQREAALGRDDLILPLHYIDVDDVDASRRGEVFDPSVLSLLRERQWVDFRSLRLRDPAGEEVQERLDAIALSIRGRLRDRTGLAAVAPPAVPNQGVGPHFVLDEAGVIRFAPPDALDPQGNNVALLRSLHPRLLELLASLAETFARTNAHEHLGGCLATYRKLLDRPLDQLDFGLLCAEGMILANADAADAADREEPDLDPAARSTLDSVLQLHGMFITATSIGLTVLAREAAWRRRPEQEREEREAAVRFAEDLQGNPHVIGPTEAAAAQEAARQIGQGPNPERSGMLATGMLRNVAIVMTAGATVASLQVGGGLEFGSTGAIAGTLFALLGGEALIRSKPFGSVAHTVTSRLNQLSEAELRRELGAIAQTLRPQLQFVLHAEPALRRLAGDREAFAWLRRSLDWIKRPDPTSDRPATSASDSGLPPTPPPPAFPIPELVLIPAGSFVMGIPEEESKRERADDRNARPLHKVTFARPFRLGRYPVTRGEYAAFVEATGYDKDGGKWRDPGFEQTGRDPVVNVSAEDAEAYAAWLNQVAGPGWRLPAEAEWEYAARAGRATARYWGNSFRQAGRYAHVAKQGKPGTAPVGARLPNAFGLYGILGNVWEWTADPWHDGYAEAPDDGSVWTTGGSNARQVLRGGSWYGGPRHLRAGYRDDDGPGNRSDGVGFRLARTFF